MAENFANDAVTHLNGDVNDSQTVITVANSTGFPAADFRIRIDSEIMKVTALSGNDWTVVRAEEMVRGIQVARAHTNKSKVAHRLTKGSLATITGGDLVAANNLSDVASAPTSRANLGVLSPAQFASINATTGTLATGKASGAAITHLTSTNAVPGTQAMRTPAQILTDT